MKILHVGPIESTRAAGGPNQSIRALTATLAEIGFEVGLLPSVPLPVSASTEKIPGVYLLKSPGRRHYNPWLISRSWITHIRAEFGTPDLVNFHSTYIPFQIALAKRFRQLSWPYIVTPRGGMTYFAQRAKRSKKLAGNFGFFRSYVKKAAAIQALTDGEAEQIQNLFKIKKIITVPNGVKDELFGAQEKLSPVDLAGFKNNCSLVLGFVGRIDVYIKGLDLLLKALEKVKRQIGESACRLLVVGPFFTSKDEKCFLSMVKRLSLENMVTNVGPRYGQDKLRHFLACDVYVQPSRTEGMPISVLEAMSLGRPCLVTLGTNMGTLVREAGGWQCQPNPESIFEAIKSIYERKDSLKTLGQRARELIQARFTWRKVAQELGEKYTEIVEKNN